MLAMISFRIEKNTYEQFKRDYPRRGDRTRILVRLIEMLLRGEVKVELVKKS